MASFNPQIYVRQLRQEDLGTFVLASGKLAFVCCGSVDRERTPRLAFFDAQSKGLVYVPEYQEEVIALDGAWIIDLDLKTLSGDRVMPGADSGSSLFIDGDDIYAVVRMPSFAKDFRLLDLKSGSVASQSKLGRSLHAVGKWRVGLKLSAIDTRWFDP